MASYQVVFFEKDDGSAPVEDFINAQDDKMAAKIYGLLTMISENGTELREPYSKFLEDGIFELRAKVGSDITRVLYFFYVGQRVVVTNGFVKKTMKTPPREISKAKACRKEYIRKEEAKKNENT